MRLPVLLCQAILEHVLVLPTRNAILVDWAACPAQEDFNESCRKERILSDWRHVVPLLELDVAVMECRGAEARKQELHLGRCAEE